MPDQRHRIDHDEAYRDDPAYTAPEMEPGHGEDLHPEPDPESVHLGSVAGLGIGYAGAAIAGEVLDEEIQDELAATDPHPARTD